MLPQLAQTLSAALALLGHLLGYQTLAILPALLGGTLLKNHWSSVPHERFIPGALIYLLLVPLTLKLYGVFQRLEWGLQGGLSAATPHWGGEALLLTPGLLAAQLLLLMLYGLFRHCSRGCSRPEERRYYDLLLLLYLLLAAAQDFLLFYLLVETANMALYRLLSLQQPRPRLEPLLSYFLLNLLGSLLLLLAFAFLYRASGGLTFGEAALGGLAGSMASEAQRGELLLGLLTLLTGLLLKLGLAPFHHWVAPIYSALPLPLFVFLMIFPKASLLLLLQQLLGLFGELAGSSLSATLLLLGALNLVWGTLGALHQTNLKRLVIHSSLANLSIYFYALAVGGVGGSGSAAFYLLLYLATTAALLLPLLASAQQPYGHWSLPALGRSSSPQLSLQLTLAALNLSGLPPFALFFGKLPVALELLEAGCYLSLALLLLFSVVAVAYTLALLLLLWYQQQPSGHPQRPSFHRSTSGLGLAPLLQLLISAQLAQDSAVALLPLEGGAYRWEEALAWSNGPTLLELQQQLYWMLLPLLVLAMILLELHRELSGPAAPAQTLRGRLQRWDGRKYPEAGTGLLALGLLPVQAQEGDAPAASEEISAATQDSAAQTAINSRAEDSVDVDSPSEEEIQAVIKTLTHKEVYDAGLVLHPKPPIEGVVGATIPEPFVHPRFLKPKKETTQGTTPYWDEAERYAAVTKIKARKQTPAAAVETHAAAVETHAAAVETTAAVKFSRATEAKVMIEAFTKKPSWQEQVLTGNYSFTGCITPWGVDKPDLFYLRNYGEEKYQLQLEKFETAKAAYFKAKDAEKAASATKTVEAPAAAVEAPAAAVEAPAAAVEAPAAGSETAPEEEKYDLYACGFKDAQGNPVEDWHYAKAIGDEYRARYLARVKEGGEFIDPYAGGFKDKYGNPLLDQDMIHYWLDQYPDQYKTKAVKVNLALEVPAASVEAPAAAVEAPAAAVEAPAAVEAHGDSVKDLERLGYLPYQQKAKTDTPEIYETIEISAAELQRYGELTRQWNDSFDWTEQREAELNALFNKILTVIKAGHQAMGISEPTEPLKNTALETMPNASVKKEDFTSYLDVWEIAIHKIKMDSLLEGSPEHKLLKQQLDLISSYYSLRIRDCLIEDVYYSKNLPLPEQQRAVEGGYAITKNQLGNLWFGLDGELSVVRVGDYEYKQLVCTDRGCKLLPVTDKEAAAFEMKRKQSLLHENLCEMLNRPNPCAGLEDPTADYYTRCMQLDSLQVFRKMGFFKGIHRQPEDPLNLQPGETGRQRLLRDLESQQSIQEWLNHFNAAPQDRLEALSGWTPCGVEPQEVRNLTYYRMVQGLLPPKSREGEDLEHYLNGVYHYRAMASIPGWTMRNQVRYAQQLPQWHFQSSGYPTEEPEEFVVRYSSYGNDAGSGIVSLLGLISQMLLSVLSVLAQSLGSHPRLPSSSRSPASGYECGFAPFAAISSSSLVVFRQLAVYFVVFEAELVFLYPWSAALLPSSAEGSVLGYYGALPFLLCLVLGFGLEIKRDALKL